MGGGCLNCRERSMYRFNTHCVGLKCNDVANHCHYQEVPVILPEAYRNVCLYECLCE